MDTLRRRHENVGEHFVRLEGVFALLRTLGRNEEIVQADFARALLTLDAHLGAEGYQDGRQARGVDEVCRAFIPKDCVVAIVAVGDERLSVRLSEQPVAEAEVPAARALAEVAAHGAARPDLRAGDALCCLHQRGIIPCDLWAVQQLLKSHGRAQAQPGLWLVLDPAQAFDILQTH